MSPGDDSCFLTRYSSSSTMTCLTDWGSTLPQSHSHSSHKHDLGLHHEVEGGGDVAPDGKRDSNVRPADSGTSLHVPIREHQSDVGSLRLCLLHHPDDHFSGVAHLLLHPALQVHPSEGHTCGELNSLPDHCLYRVSRVFVRKERVTVGECLLTTAGSLTPGERIVWERMRRQRHTSCDPVAPAIPFFPSFPHLVMHVHSCICSPSFL